MDTYFSRKLAIKWSSESVSFKRYLNGKRYMSTFHRKVVELKKTCKKKSMMTYLYVEVNSKIDILSLVA